MTPLIATAPARHQFRELTVVSKEQLTDGAVVIGLGVPSELAEAFRYQAGQHITLRVFLNGEDTRRSYSLCDDPAVAEAAGVLRCGVATVRSGAMSTFVNETLQVGDVVEVMPPQGSFTTTFDPAVRRRHVAIAAGSGITPILALLRTALREEPQSDATLIFGNRYTRSIMFLEEIADLKNLYPERFNVAHVLSREGQDSEIINGRMDAAKLGAILDHVLPGGHGDVFYLCGPYGLVQTAHEVLRERGVPDAAVHDEVFHVDDSSAPPPIDIPDAAAEATVTISLDGRTTVITMPSRAETILEATLRTRPDAPYSCTGGVCGTCRARVTQGEVTMARNYALEPEEIAAGVVLACQAHPVTDEVTLDYDV